MYYKKYIEGNNSKVILLQKNRIKKWSSIFFAVGSLVFLSVMGIVSAYDLLVYNISDNVSELCARYSFVISPEC